MAPKSLQDKRFDLIVSYDCGGVNDTYIIENCRAPRTKDEYDVVQKELGCLYPELVRIVGITKIRKRRSIAERIGITLLILVLVASSAAIWVGNLALHTDMTLLTVIVLSVLIIDFLRGE